MRTGVVPTASSTGPATNSPSGLTSAQSVITVVITVGRIGGGTRSVEIACRLGLTSPLPIPETTIAAESAAAGTGSHNSQSGTTWITMNVVKIVSPSKRRVR